MTASPPRRRKKNPYNPVHDRTSKDLLRNAQVTPVEVDDPYEEGGKIIVMRSTRDDPLAEMRARGFIDDCHYEAGRHWQRAWENAEIGGVCGIDPTKEAVDGGRMRDVLTDRQIQAVKDLTEARGALGVVGAWLITSVLGTRKSLQEVARESAGEGGPVRGEYDYLRRRFRQCLDRLAKIYGYEDSKVGVRYVPG